MDDAARLRIERARREALQVAAKREAEAARALSQEQIALRNRIDAWRRFLATERLGGYPRALVGVTRWSTSQKSRFSSKTSVTRHAEHRVLYKAGLINQYHSVPYGDDYNEDKPLWVASDETLWTQDQGAGDGFPQFSCASRYGAVSHLSSLVALEDIPGGSLRPFTKLSQPPDQRG